mmetsp:Transcript_53498/g.148753  ORF Transcript_53498/g.148753 Transcript_53498/m.148753 type:complete len:152 (-) Transcript_53498:114-569(-)
MVRSRAGTRLAAAILLAAASYAVLPPLAFAPLRAAAVAGAVLAGVAAGDDAGIAPPGYGLDVSSVQVAVNADTPVYQGGAIQGGLDGTFKPAVGAKMKDFVDDENFLKNEAKYEEKFDQNVGIFTVLFVGAFIAPMVTYFWYVRDTDPWQN